MPIGMQLSTIIPPVPHTSFRAFARSSVMRTRLSRYPAALSCFLLAEPSRALQILQHM